MNSQKDNGGPAFPRPYSQHDDSNTMLKAFDEQGGMSMRDWFAGMALIGMIASPRSPVAEDGITAPKYVTAEIYARHAYSVADAMLRERAK